LTTYKIIEATEDSKVGYQPFGAAADLWMCKAHEVIISGPAETGKTRAALEKLDALLWKYPNTHALIVRKTRSSMDASVLKTYQDKVLTEDTPILAYGGSKPEWFDYPNGSRLVVGGLDKAGKVLSAEYDVVYVNQAEELALEDWETLTTRCTGRAGNMPYAQIMGDCNPGPRTHWILGRANNNTLTMLESRHEHNPVLYDQDSGEITEQGEITMASLDSLTGVRYSRLRLGKWVSAEGQIFEGYDPAIHLVDDSYIGPDFRRIRVIDFGYVNPFTCQWWAIDHDGRMFLYRQIYMTGRTVSEHAAQIIELSGHEAYEATICDHDAEDRATLRAHGIPNAKAYKDVARGIGAVQDRLKIQRDGKPRLFIVRNSLVEIDRSLQQEYKPFATEQEFDGYVWKDNARKDEPVKENDHGMDALRYAVMYLDSKRQTEVVRYSPRSHRR
jgi:phage terminase large subunit